MFRCSHLQILQTEVFPLLSGFYDTPFIVWLLKTKDKYFEKVLPCLHHHLHSWGPGRLPVARLELTPDTCLVVRRLANLSCFIGRQVFFEDQIGLNRHWLQMQWGNEDVETLVTHYAGELEGHSLRR